MDRINLTSFYNSRLGCADFGKVENIEVILTRIGISDDFSEYV